MLAAGQVANHRGSCSRFGGAEWVSRAPRLFRDFQVQAKSPLTCSGWLPCTPLKLFYCNARTLHAREANPEAARGRTCLIVAFHPMLSSSASPPLFFRALEGFRILQCLTALHLESRSTPSHQFLQVCLSFKVNKDCMQHPSPRTGMRHCLFALQPVFGSQTQA